MSGSHTIAADDDGTWPPDLLALLDQRLPDLRSYHGERRRIDTLGETDLAARFRPPPNPWKETHDETIAIIDTAIRDAQLIGYHCTRLTADERIGIQRDGLRATGGLLAADRVSARVAAGEISDHLGALLLANNCADHTGASSAEYGSRKGMVWFVFTRGPLREEHGISRLLSLWGGEMLYWHHADNLDIVNAVRTVGTACIIEAAVPVREIECYGSVGERLLRWFLHQRGVQTEHADDWEGHTKVSIASAGIRRIIGRADPIFEGLTGCTGWSDPVT